MSVQDWFDIRGRAALVTGAGRGIGRVLALALAEAGCRVALLGLHRENLECTAGEIEALGGASLVLKADVSLSDQVSAAFRVLEKTFGRLDICVNNAGISLQGAAEEIKEADWERIMEVNLKGVFLCSQAAARIMIPLSGLAGADTHG